MQKNIRVAMIVGEVSGDILGSRLIQSWQIINNGKDNIEFEGISGVEMQKMGCKTLYPMEKLSVMGFLEVLPRLFELLNIRRKLFQYWKKNPPDVFIGIDAPDFNLKLEAKLHRIGIKTVHYVSPSIWAWREKRVKKIQGNLDLMLTLFPFEVDFYHKHQIPAKFVGHPLADEIPLQSNQIQARQILNLSPTDKILAVLPGSRTSEIKYLAADFLKSCQLLQQQHQNLIFIVPLINTKIKQQFLEIKKSIAPKLKLSFIDGQSRIVMTAANYILLASGTAVLEGMLIGRPMIAAYRVAPFTAIIIRAFNMIKVKYFTLPNNLANEALVPELIQEDITATNIVKVVNKIMSFSVAEKKYLQHKFTQIHQQLRQNASKTAVKSIMEILRLS